MLYSKLFPKALKYPPHDADSVNARYLIRGGFIHQESSGIWSWLPLGLRVLYKIENIIREEMNALGAQELLMPALQPKENWEKTKRWESFEALLKLKSKSAGELALGPTHEEIIFPLVKSYLNSYQDLPLFLYQIQNKYRDELRAKAGLLRGREFGMKDLYSFHSSVDDLEDYYEKVAAAYLRVFKKCGLEAIRVKAGGGTFSEFSDEFQVITSAGEDIIHYCSKCKIYYNAELLKDNKCVKGHQTEGGQKAIEVGNIFKLKPHFADSFDLTYLDKDGKKKKVITGCYGLGTTRLVGAMVEANHDEKGIIWPKEVAPYSAHLIAIFSKDKKINKKISSLCRSFPASSTGQAPRKRESQGIEALYDDRADVSAGEKFVTADLLGIPLRIVISPKSLAQGMMEIKDRKTGKIKMKKL